MKAAKDRERDRVCGQWLRSSKWRGKVGIEFYMCLGCWWEQIQWFAAGNEDDGLRIECDVCLFQRGDVGKISGIGLASLVIL